MPIPVRGTSEGLSDTHKRQDAASLTSNPFGLHEDCSTLQRPCTTVSQNDGARILLGSTIGSRQVDGCRLTIWKANPESVGLSLDETTLIDF